MSPLELRRLASTLGNGGWCRHWFRYNYPLEPVVMAIQVLEAMEDGRFQPVEIPDLDRLGFTHEYPHIYTITRTEAST